ncbi:MAG: DMT family transporter [Betaproteobacteria bacterium]
MSVRARPFGIYAALVVMAVCWGGAFIGGRIAVAEMTPLAAALWRYVIATIALLAVAFALERGLPRLAARQWLAVALLGATGVVMFNLFFMYGLARVPASRGSLIMALNPAITLLGAVLFLHERLTRNKVFGIVVALAGVAIVLSHGNPADLVRGSVGVGEVVLFGCPIAWAAYTLIGKRMLTGISAIAVTTYAALTGTAMLAVLAAFSGDLLPPVASLRAWMAIAFVGLFGTALAFVLFYEGVRTIGPARTSVFINLVPVAAIVFGVLLLGEPLDASMLVGGALVIAGVLLLNRPQAAPHAAVAAAG